MSAEEDVFIFRNVSFKLKKGGGYNVAKVVLDLDYNSVPCCTVLLDPAHQVKAPVDTATNSRLGEFYDISQLFIAAAEKHELASLYLEVVSVDGSGGEAVDTLDLQDWVVGGGGIVGVSATGSFSLSVTLYHPVFLANVNGYFAGALDDTSIQGPNGEIQAAKNVMDLLDIVAGYYSANNTHIQMDGLGIPPQCGGVTLKTLDDSMKSLLEQIKTSVKNFIKYTDWDGDLYSGSYGAPASAKWPLEWCLGAHDTGGVSSADYVSAVKWAIAQYVTGRGEFNILSLMLNTIMPQMDLGLIPVFNTSKVLIRPNTYWDKPQYIIADTDISDIEFPGVDPYPITGVRVFMGEAASGDYTTWRDIDMLDMTRVTEVVYIPESIQKAMQAGDIPVGRLVDLAAPAWLESVGQVLDGMVSMSGNKAQENQLYGATAEVGGKVAVQASISYMNWMAALKTAMGIMAQTYFMSLYRQNVVTKVSCRLMLTIPDAPTPGNYLLPGYSCGIESDADGEKRLYNFFITKVMHVIDIQGKQAFTEIAGAYVRPDQQAKGYTAPIKEGTMNLLYCDPA